MMVTLLGADASFRTTRLADCLSCTIEAVHIRAELTQRNITRAIRQLESRIRDVAPDMRQIFIAIASLRS